MIFQMKYFIIMIWVAGHNVTGQNVTDKMSRTKCYVDKMPLDKMSWSKCSGQFCGQTSMNKFWVANEYAMISNSISLFPSLHQQYKAQSVEGM